VNIKSKIYYLKPKLWDRHHKIHFSLNILFGIIIALILHFFELTSIGNKILASEMDQIIKKEAVISKVKDSNIVFIDIDSETEYLWNTSDVDHSNLNKYNLNTLITRRDSLSSLLRKISKFNPRIIVIDMMFKYYSDFMEHDSIFINFINEFKKSNSNTKIIIPYPNDITDLKEHNIYKYLVNSKNIYFASVSVASEFNERTIRYIYTYKNISQNEKLWSVPVLAYCIMNNININTLTIEKLWENGVKLEDENPFHSEGINFLSSRIRYLLTPTVYDNYTGKKTFFGNIDYKPDIRFSGLEIISYQDGGVEPYFPDSYLSNKIRNNIVVIGNSTVEKGDIHLTPIGEIPGMYIIGNAIHTIINKGLVKSTPFTIFFIIELLTIIICAYLFLFLEDIIASIFGFIVIGIPLSYASYFIFLYTGYFLTSTFALIGIAMHKIIIDIEKLVYKTRQKTIEEHRIEYEETNKKKIHFNQ
jgi:hypothetical protein